MILILDGYDERINATDILAIETILNTLKRYDNELDLDYVDKNYISKDKIKEILEELLEIKYEIEKDINNAKFMKEDINYIKDLKWQLTRQNGKIDIIEKLLEDK